LWKAEKWDPDRLMWLYRKAGARYFVSMGSHHDNFHLWNSKHHRWNAVNMGPQRDVVGEWQQAAKKYGLRFGVSEHLGASFWWFQVSHGSDKTGPLAGVPYDGADPKYQDLYHWLASPKDKGGWYSTDLRWQKEWFDCITDLIDNYPLDLLYTDGGVPFGDEALAGRSMIAHLYNTDVKRRGSLEVVYNCKQPSQGRWVQDLERGVMSGINPYPWQTDTSIADWFYNRNWKYRPTSWVIYLLADIVSKNGNLLLNVVQRPDGSLDPEVEKMLGQLAAWNAVNGEAIFGTRPWLVYGEGPIKAKGGHFNEDYNFTACDIRFTTKGPTLYAITLGLPKDGRLLVRSLAKPAGQDINNIATVSLLGHQGKIDWKQTADGLEVTLPEEKPSKYACALKITGAQLKPPPAVEAEVQGLYEGTGKDATGADFRIEARVVAQGSGNYKVLLRQIRGKDHITRVELAANTTDGVVTLSGKAGAVEWSGAYDGGAIIGECRPGGPFVMNRVDKKSPTLGKQPPPEAIVLLDGKDFSELLRNNGAALQVAGKDIGADGSIQILKGGLISKRKFLGSFDLHVEFQNPLMPAAHGQQRGNSGVFMPNGDEIQVLDSFGEPTYLGGGCGGIYCYRDPDAMEPIESLKGKGECNFTLASLPPLAWQTYDVQYRVEANDVKYVPAKQAQGKNVWVRLETKDGKPLGQPRITVYHNGVKIHDNFAIRGNICDEAPLGRLHFQDHNDPVRFRNIWVVPVEQK
jgi:alpha-L-fucosidase